MTMLPLVKGLMTYLPGVPGLLSKTGGTSSARYCYSVWLRHLVMADKSGVPTPPLSVAELGPGDSLGTGIASLLSGANRYYALDVIRLIDVKHNLIMLDELIDLFDRRESIPDESEFPEVKPHLDTYEFPHHILSEDVLRRSLAGNRIKAIKNSLKGTGSGKDDLEISYRAPWFAEDVVQPESMDLVISQAVLEHVDDFEHTYTCINRWLKPGGMMSHQIDFRAHGTAKEWNGHWRYSTVVWNLIKGKRPYPINRQPYHAHVDMIKKCGFEIVNELRAKSTSNINRDELADPFRSMPLDDLTTSGAFIQAVKKAKG